MQLELTYQPELDRRRLTTLLELVEYTMLPGAWWTLGELRAHMQRGSEAGISAVLGTCGSRATQ